MKKILVALFCAMISTYAMAGGGLDGFLSKLNAQAKSDLANFSARISAKFSIPEAQVRVVIGTVKQPADAFMIFQLGKMASQPTEKVMDVYQSGQGKGWGALAKELGIKPGSAEFHALKRGDLQLEGVSDDGPGKGKNRGKEKH